MRELIPAQADDLYELITERAGASLVLTSNRSPQDWYPLFPTPSSPSPSSTGFDNQQQPPGLHERPQLPAQGNGPAAVSPRQARKPPMRPHDQPPPESV